MEPVPLTSAFDVAATIRRTTASPDTGDRLFIDRVVSIDPVVPGVERSVVLASGREAIYPTSYSPLVGDQVMVIASGSQRAIIGRLAVG